MTKMSRIPSEVAHERARRAAAALARDRRVRLVFLFGSATDPSRDLVRDVDLAVLTDHPLGLYEGLDLQAEVARAAGGDIDLVFLNDAPVVLAHEVAETGHCLHADPPEVETEFVSRARMRYFDFKPYLEEQWKLLGERLEERRRRLSEPEPLKGRSV